MKCTSTSRVILVVYVDDIVLAGDDLVELQSLKQFLDGQFRIKDLGNVHYFLGMEVSHHKQGYLVSQHKFTLDLLHEFNCHQFSPVSTPLDCSFKFVAAMGSPLADPSSYRCLVGKLNFLQHMRPDISFSVQHLSQFLQRPQVSHMLAAIHVLRYLMNSPDQGILLSNTSGFSFLGFSDSIRLLVMTLDVLLLIFLSHWVLALFLGKVRNNLPFLCPLLKPSIELFIRLSLKSFGLFAFFMTLV